MATNSFLLSHQQLREAVAGAPVSVGGLPCLRWPSGPGEVVETVALSPVGVGPSSSRSRVRFPGAAAARRWRPVGIRSSCAFPRLGNILLRCWRRAHGGKVRFGRILYTRLSPTVFCCLCEAMDLAALSLKDAMVATASFDPGTEGLRVCPRPRFIRR